MNKRSISRLDLTSILCIFGLFLSTVSGSEQMLFFAATCQKVITSIKQYVILPFLPFSLSQKFSYLVFRAMNTIILSVFENKLLGTPPGN